MGRPKSNAFLKLGMQPKPKKMDFEVEILTFEKSSEIRSGMTCRVVENHSLGSGKWFGMTLDHIKCIRSHFKEKI